MTLTDHLKENLEECTPTLEPSEKLRRSRRSLQPQHANFSANKNSLRFRDTNRQDEEGSCFSRTPPHRALQGSGDRTVGKHRAKKFFQDYIRHDTSLPQRRVPSGTPNKPIPEIKSQLADSALQLHGSCCGALFEEANEPPTISCLKPQ